MPMFTVARQYLVPIVQHVTVEATDETTACHAVMDDNEYPWDGARTDWESARAMTIVGVWAGDAAYAGTAMTAPTALAGDD